MEWDSDPLIKTEQDIDTKNPVLGKILDSFFPFLALILSHFQKTTKECQL